MKLAAKFNNKICVMALLLPLLSASCGARDIPDSVSGVEKGDTVSSSPQEDSSVAEAHRDGGSGKVAVADYIEMDDWWMRLCPGDDSQSYAINGEWMYVTDHMGIVDEEKSQEESLFCNFGITRQRLEDGYLERNYADTGMDMYDNKPLLLADREGNCYIFWRSMQEEATVYSLDKYGTEGNLLWRRELSDEELEGMGERLDQGMVTRDGRVILYSYGKGGLAFCYGTDGSQEEIYEPGLESLEGIAAGKDDRLYGYCVTGKEPVFVELGSGEPYVCPVRPLAVYDGYEEGICLRTGEGMFTYVPESGETVQLWGWADDYIQLNTNRVYSVFQEDGVFTLLCGTDIYPGYDKELYAEVARVTFEDSGEYPGKQHVTLATDIEANTTKMLVQRYNRHSREYRVEIVPTKDSNALQMQLLRGEGADLMEVGRIYKGDLARQGAFEDLSPYYENSTVVREEDILDPIREACTIGGKNVTVIPAFEIDTMRARGDFVTSDEWTVWKFLEMGRENRMMCTQDPMKALNICMGTSFGEHFINYEDMTCSFDGEEFRRMLEACAKWPEYKEYSAEGYLIEQTTKKGDWLFDTCTICKPTNLVTREPSGDPDAYEYEGEDYASTLVGYPGWEGGEYRIAAYSILAVNSASQHKDGAWDFLEYMLSEDFQAMVQDMLAQCPVRKDSYEAYTKNDIEDGWWSEALTEKDIRKMDEMLESAKLNDYGRADDPIGKIVSEEAEMYFAGDADLEETVQKIQNRVQNYLNEL